MVDLLEAYRALAENNFHYYSHEQTAHNSYNGYYHQMQLMHQYQANNWPQPANFWNNYDRAPPEASHIMVQMPEYNIQNAHSGDEANKLVKSPPSNNTRITKRKRTRTMFTTEQTQTLERHFRKRPYISPDERKILSEKLGVGDKVVKVWFQNRRLKEKRIKRDELAESVEKAEATNELQNKMSHAHDVNSNASNFDVPAVSDFTPSILESPNVYSENNMKYYEPISSPDSNQEILDLNTTFAPVDPEISLRTLLCL